MAYSDPRQPLNDQTICRGDNFKWTVTITKTNVDGSTSPVDLTTYGTSWSGQLRGNPDYTTFVDWTIDATNASTGVLVLSLSSATTTTMLLPVYYYDLQVTGGTVSPQTPFRGTLYVVKDVTHA